VWVGGDERPVFQEQAKQLADAWGVDLVVSEGEHHFNVIEPLADRDSRLVKALLS
jgi:arylformamidase